MTIETDFSCAVVADPTPTHHDVKARVAVVDDTDISSESTSSRERSVFEFFPHDESEFVGSDRFEDVRFCGSERFVEVGTGGEVGNNVGSSSKVRLSRIDRSVWELSERSESDETALEPGLSSLAFSARSTVNCILDRAGRLRAASCIGTSFRQDVCATTRLEDPTVS